MTPGVRAALATAVLCLAACSARPAGTTVETAVGTRVETAAGTSTGTAPATAPVSERLVLDAARLTIYEYVFPAGFRGEEHAAIADEVAYVLEGELTVVTRGRGARVLRPGEAEYAARGTVHVTLNESPRPARVLVVLLKDG